ncbi:host-nuclease inhibitor Gam family protein [Lysobacter sp. CA196]|uniref:host-nuclease inhibitor Gam family protein n=1 Tax=Lysobacter sp. CA196 TaxID=3455606 RepID=UPI003F8D76E9
MTNMTQIEETARRYAAMRDDLGAAINTMNIAFEAIKTEHLDRVRAALRDFNTAEDELHALLLRASELFAKPRTRVFHGVKVGFQKGKGGLAIKDETRTVALIRKHLHDQADALIRVTEKPVKDALQQLEAVTLKKIGVEIVSATDDVVIRATDTDLDKYIKALRGDAGLTEESSEC